MKFIQKRVPRKMPRTRHILGDCSESNKHYNPCRKTNENYIDPNYALKVRQSNRSPLVYKISRS